MDSFHKESSDLVRLFVRRVTGTESAPEATMGALIDALRRSAGLKGRFFSLDPCLKIRKILAIEYVAHLGYDGAIQPLGGGYENGFKLIIKSDCSSTRVRFTIAHELCHTFFYETIPEVKFRNHEVDPGEERLCNFGAAELLIPSRALKRQAKGLGKSLDSLEVLATLFNVSLEAMLLRLRAAGLWESELSVWRLMTGGNFSLHRLVGGRRVEWEWSESHLLRDVWNTGRTLSGSTYMQYRDREGGLRLRAVSYELKRRRDALLALWNRPSNHRAQLSMPLFEHTKPPDITSMV
jgi:hypothetical protein